MKQTELIEKLKSILLSAGIVTDYMFDRLPEEMTHRQVTQAGQELYGEMTALLSAVEAAEQIEPRFTGSDFPPLAPYKVQQDCPKCGMPMPVTFEYRTIRMAVVKGEGRWPWQRMLKIVETHQEHLRAKCPTCGYSIEMECYKLAPKPVPEPEIEVDWSFADPVKKTRRVCTVLTPSGVRADGHWDDPSQIPPRLPDRFENYFNTADTEVVWFDIPVG